MSSPLPDHQPAAQSATRASEKNTARVEAFSDGVIAIAITLLVLELHVPHLEAGASPSELLDSLLALLPNYIAFLTSFSTIGIIWINHHNLFKLIRRVDHWFLVMNGVLLLAISFLSFPTELFAEYMFEPGGTVAAVFYASTFILIAGSFNVLFRYAASRHLFDPDVDQAFIPAIKRQYTFAFLLYLTSMIVGFFSPVGTYILVTLLAIFFLLPNRISAELDAVG